MNSYEVFSQPELGCQPMASQAGSERKRILVAMSGGVDSSVAAALLLQQGYEVVGLTAHLHDEGEGMAHAIEDAAAVCACLGIEHVVLDLRERFRQDVIDPFITAYTEGLTPNPCVICNRRIKFGALLDALADYGADALATGHYARCHYDAEKKRWQLMRGVEAARDQSYVLYHLRQEQLAKLCFPCGELYKADIREEARRLGLPIAERPDSQDICFIPDGNYRAYLQKYRQTEDPVGDFVDRQGRVLGQHKGISSYTVGQRRGLGIASDEPLYVERIDAETRQIHLAKASELDARKILAEGVNWLACEEPAEHEPIQCRIRTRYHQRELPATVESLPGQRALIQTDDILRVAAPGQAVVFYEGDVVLGGGRIIQVQAR